MIPADYRNFEMKLAFHAAPALLGIKCANLISFPANKSEVLLFIEKFNKKAVSRGLKSRILCKCKKHMLVLIYNEKMLQKHFSDVKIKNILMEYDYPYNADISEYLEVLSNRILESDSFPHEIGIFLGYPIEDVIGFIQNKGENFKLCGCWKVYGCENSARRAFENYDKCRKFLCNKLNNGADIYQALKIS